MITVELKTKTANKNLGELTSPNIVRIRDSYYIVGCDCSGKHHGEATLTCLETGNVIHKSFGCVPDEIFTQSKIIIN